MVITNNRLAYLNDHLDLVAEYIKSIFADRTPPVETNAHLECTSVAKISRVVMTSHGAKTRLNLVKITLNIDVHSDGSYRHFDNGRLLLKYVEEHDPRAYVLK